MQVERQRQVILTALHRLITLKATVKDYSLPSKETFDVSLFPSQKVAIRLQLQTTPTGCSIGASKHKVPQAAGCFAAGCPAACWLRRVSTHLKGGGGSSGSLRRQGGQRQQQRAAWGGQGGRAAAAGRQQRRRRRRTCRPGGDEPARGDPGVLAGPRSQNCVVRRLGDSGASRHVFVCFAGVSGGWAVYLCNFVKG